MRQYQEVQQEKPQTETQTDKETCQTSIKLDKQFENFKKSLKIIFFQFTEWFEFSIYFVTILRCKFGYKRFKF